MGDLNSYDQVCKESLSDEHSDNDLIDKALNLYRRKQYSQAEEVLYNISSSYDELSKLSILSLIRYRQQQYQKSIELGKECILLSEKDPDVYNTIGLAYHGLHMYSEAVKYFDKSIKADPINTTWHFNKLHALIGQGSHIEADKTALKVKDLAANVIRLNKGLYNRDVLKARIEMGDLCLQINSIDDAIKHGKVAQLIYDELDEFEQDLHDLDLIKELSVSSIAKLND